MKIKLSPSVNTIHFSDLNIGDVFWVLRSPNNPDYAGPYMKIRADKINCLNLHNGNGFIFTGINVCGVQKLKVKLVSDDD